MKESIWGYWIVVLGISIMGVMIVLQNYTTTNEQDYYMIREVLEASMYDSVDYAYFRVAGEFKMNAEKFVENFTRRFSETVNINKKYTVTFYDIYEIPPAASVAITTKTSGSAFGSNQGAADEEATIVNRLTGILYSTDRFQARFDSNENVLTN